MFDSEDWFEGSRSAAWYDTALICPNGHIINDSMKAHPVHNKKFCPHCGEKAISQCLSCSTEIQGECHYPNVAGLGMRTPPKHCHSCGAPYPWTAKKIKATKDVIAGLGLPQPAVTEMGALLEELVQGAPTEAYAAHRFTQLLGKAKRETGPYIKNLLGELLKDLVSETVQKIIWPQ